MYLSNITIAADESVTDVIEHAIKLYSYTKVHKPMLSKDYYSLSNMMWYEENPEIMAIIDMLNALDNHKWAFVRVGNDIEDVEIRGDTEAMKLDVQVKVRINE